MSFADRLTQLRTHHGLSQEELAGKLGVSRQTIGKWENGLAAPEMAGLIALSDYFAVSIDALVKDDACQISIPTNMEESDLRSFLLRAKRSTYAAHCAETTPSRTDSHDFIYSEGDLTYRDSYFGGATFHGEEVVWSGSRVIWCMNYSGRTLSDSFSGDFLKFALHSVTAEAPYRGPHFLQRSGYTYLCQSRGNLEWFSGDEVIFFGDTLAYECRFHGGITR